MATRRRGLANTADAAKNEYLAREAIPAAQRADRRTYDTLFDATLQDGTIRDWAPDELKGDKKQKDVIRQEQETRKTTRAMRFFIRVTPGIASELSGVAPISDQSVITLHNISDTVSFEALHDSPESSEGFRILFPAGIDYTVPPLGVLQIRYDFTSKAYRPVTSTALTTDQIINVTNVAGDVLTTVINTINTTIINLGDELEALGWPGVLDIDRNTGNLLLGGHNPNINTGDRMEFGNTGAEGHPAGGHITTDDDLVVRGLSPSPLSSTSELFNFDRSAATLTLGNFFSLGLLAALSSLDVLIDADLGTLTLNSGTDTIQNIGDDWQVNITDDITWTSPIGDILDWDFNVSTFTVGSLVTDVVEQMHVLADAQVQVQGNGVGTGVNLRAPNGDVESFAGLATRIQSAITLENSVEVTVTGGTTIDDWDIAGVENAEVILVRGTGDGIVTITGIAEHRLGKLVTFIVLDEEITLRFEHLDTGSLAANRLLLPRTNRVDVGAYESISFWRNDTESRWNTWGEGGGAGPGAIPGGLTWAQSLLNGRFTAGVNPNVILGDELELGTIGLLSHTGTATVLESSDDLQLFATGVGAVLNYDRGTTTLNLGSTSASVATQTNLLSNTDIRIDAQTGDIVIEAGVAGLISVDSLQTDINSGAINIGLAATTQVITIAATGVAGDINLQATDTIELDAASIVLNAFTGFLRADAGLVSTALISGSDVVAADFDWGSTLARGRFTEGVNPNVVDGDELEFAALGSIFATAGELTINTVDDFAIQHAGGNLLFWDESASILELGSPTAVNITRVTSTQTLQITAGTSVQVAMADDLSITASGAGAILTYDRGLLDMQLGSISASVVATLTIASGGDMTLDAVDDINILGADVLIGDAGTTLVQLNNIGNFDVNSAGSILLGDGTLTDAISLQTAGNVTIKAFTGVLRADAGVVSVDSDVSDLVTKTWAQVLTAGRTSGASNPLIAEGQYLEFDTGASAVPGSGNLRVNNDLLVNVGGSLSMQVGTAGDITIAGNAGSTALLSWTDATGVFLLGNGGVTTTTTVRGTNINVGDGQTTLIQISPTAGGADVELAPTDQVRLYPLGQLLLGHATNTDSISMLTAGAISATAGATFDITLTTTSTGDVVLTSGDRINATAAGRFSIDSGELLLITSTDETRISPATNLELTPGTGLYLGQTNAGSITATLVSLACTGDATLVPAGALNLGSATTTDNVVYNTAGAHRFASGRMCMADVVTNSQSGTVEAMTNPAGQVVLWNGTAATNLDGITAPTAGDDGQCFWFINMDEEFSVVVRHDQATTAANGIYVNANKDLQFTDAAFFWYNNSISRWMCMVFRDN
jgi:hypothetical protein